MSDLKVSWTVEGHFDIGNMLDHVMDVQVHHEAGACPPCRANNNTMLIPFPGCRGEERHAKAAGYGCRCTVVLVNSD